MRVRSIAATLACLLVAASAFAQFASEHDRQEALLHYRNGQELMNAEQFEPAAAEFQLAIDHDRLLTLAHYGLGRANMELHRFASAIKAFLGCREAFLMLDGMREGDRFAADRQRDDQIRELKEGMRRLQESNGGRQNDLKILSVERQIEDLNQQGRNSRMKGAFAAPPEVSLSLGSAYFRNGQLEDAEREWKAAVAANSRFGEAHNNLAALYAMTGRKQDAEAAVRSAEKAGFHVNPHLKDDIKKLPGSR